MQLIIEAADSVEVEMKMDNLNPKQCPANDLIDDITKDRPLTQELESSKSIIKETLEKAAQNDLDIIIDLPKDNGKIEINNVEKNTESHKNTINKDHDMEILQQQGNIKEINNQCEKTDVTNSNTVENSIETEKTESETKKDHLFSQEDSSNSIYDDKSSIKDDREALEEFAVKMINSPETKNSGVSLENNSNGEDMEIDYNTNYTQNKTISVSLELNISSEDDFKNNLEFEKNTSEAKINNVQSLDKNPSQIVEHSSEDENMENKKDDENASLPNDIISKEFCNNLSEKIDRKKNNVKKDEANLLQEKLTSQEIGDIKQTKEECDDLKLDENNKTLYQSKPNDAGDANMETLGVNNDILTKNANENKPVSENDSNVPNDIQLETSDNNEETIDDNIKAMDVENNCKNNIENSEIHNNDNVTNTDVNYEKNTIYGNMENNIIKTDIIDESNTVSCSENSESMGSNVKRISTNDEVAMDVDNPPIVSKYFITNEKNNSTEDKLDIREKYTNTDKDIICIDKTNVDQIDQNDSSKGKKIETDLDPDTVIEENKLDSMETTPIEQVDNTDLTLDSSDDEQKDLTEKESELNVNDNNECKTDEDKIKIKETLETVDLSSDVTTVENNKETKIVSPVKRHSICGLSNKLDILSDDDDDDVIAENMEKPTENKPESSNDSTSKCINIDDDDDVMVIDETQSAKEEEKVKNDDKAEPVSCNLEKGVSLPPTNIETSETVSNIEKDVPEITSKGENNEKETKTENQTKPKPLVSEKFLKAFKKNVAEMTRDELEEFCLMKIVEGVIDRSNLGDIQSRLKTMSQTIEEWKKKANSLTKQNRDLNIVVKTVQEELKKKTESQVTPLKITRSVGMQVLIVDSDRSNRRKALVPPSPKKGPALRPKLKPNSPSIPVPKLVPAAANSSPVKPVKPQLQNATVTSNTGKAASTNNRAPNKRPLSQSFTVDLTDDEPPSKQLITLLNAPPAPVRLVNQQQLMAKPQTVQSSGPRKVFIPINNQPPQANVRHSFMFKSTPVQRGRAPGDLRAPTSTVRLRMRPAIVRHPAPLPELAKQQQPPNWKSLPPAPDLKITKVDNGIVISWKIDGYQEDSYEEIASYQLYAYQETNAPPSTLLWKKIGDVKALPLPMACTLTQFMAGFKYYFAVRAIDIRSRIGPFSLPGSILLLNK